MNKGYSQRGSKEALQTALTGVKHLGENAAQNPGHDAEGADKIWSVWKDLIADRLLGSAKKIPETPNWMPPTEIAPRNHAPPELAVFIQKWTDNFNVILIRQCFSILKFQSQLLPPESYRSVLSNFADKNSCWGQLNEVMGDEVVHLARKLPEWNWWPLIKDDRSWLSDDQNIRLKYFDFLRQTNPNKARSLLTHSWDSEPLSIKKKFMMRLQPGLSMKDTPFLLKTLKERDVVIRTTSFIYLARLEEPGITFELNTQFHGYMSRSFQWIGNAMRFKPLPPESISLPDECSHLTILTNYTLDDHLRWLTLIHPREFSAYIDSESHVKQILSAGNLEDLCLILLHSVTFHKDIAWAERLVKCGPFVSMDGRKKTPWAGILRLLPVESINRLVTEVLQKNSEHLIADLVIIARNSDVIWTLNNSEDTVRSVLDMVDMKARGHYHDIQELLLLGLKLDPRIYPKYKHALDRIRHISPEVKIFENILQDRFRMLGILLNS